MLFTDEDFELTVLSLSRMTFLTCEEKFILLNKLDSLHSLSILSIEDIAKFFNRKLKASWDAGYVINSARRDQKYLARQGISWLLYGDQRFPCLLEQIADPPFLLYYRGDISILGKPGVSVVGTRKITGESMKACVEFCKDACLDGVNVISGLAFGVDKKAHEGALEAYYNAEDTSKVGRTIAVLPGAVDQIVPYSHRKLALDILRSGGLLLSEYPPGVGAEPFRFIERNRIIAGLSEATVVIQAPPGSGAMLTAEFAVGYDREVIFHKAAFSESSMRISAFEKARLTELAKKNKSDRNKLKNDPELFVNDGAPVIEDYADFIKCLSEAPGRRGQNG